MAFPDSPNRKGTEGIPRFPASPIAVIVPAAGSGRRMGGEKKQYRLLGGAPVLVQTLRRFAAHPEVQHLIVVVGAEEVDAVRSELAEYGVAKLAAVVPGGATRQDSVAAGLAAVPRACEVVLVHDAVRPFVTAAQISAVIAAIKKEGAAALAVPVVDTVRRVSGDGFGETVEREGLYRMQTPQGSRTEWLREAHRQAREKNWQATDEVALLQLTGYPVRLVPGSEDNFKITRPEDWARAEGLWEESESEPTADVLHWLQEWYQEQCNGDWEHQYGVSIQTLDNPGWSIEVALVDTPLEGLHLPADQFDRSVNNWYSIKVENARFVGVGDASKLSYLLHRLKRVIQENT